MNEQKYALTKRIRAKALGSTTAMHMKHGFHMLASDGVPVLSSEKARDDMVACLLQKVSDFYTFSNYVGCNKSANFVSNMC